MSLRFPFSDLEGWRKACVWSSSTPRSLILIFTISSKKEWFQSCSVFYDDIVIFSSDRQSTFYMLSFQFSSVTQSCLTLCNPMNCSTPGLPVHHQLPECTQTYVHWVGDAIQPSHPHPLLLLPTIFPSIRVFSNESVLCISWTKYWSFSLSISPSNEHPGLISFRMDWLDILPVQGTLKSLLQYHSSKASILRC